jgi:hypothetical protein
MWAAADAIWRFLHGKRYSTDSDLLLSNRFELGGEHTHLGAIAIDPYLEYL